MCKEKLNPLTLNNQLYINFFQLRILNTFGWGGGE